jgi:hypothetical protein
LEEVKHILTDKRLSAIKSMLEKDHAIDCIFLLYMDKGRWKDAKEFMESLGLGISDGTFRARMMEMVELGLAESVQIDRLRSYYVKTELCEKVARLLIDFFKALQQDLR